MEANMKPDEKRAVAQLMRRLTIFIAERRALITLLKQAEAEHRPPGNWKADLAALQETPQYHAVLEANEPMIVQLEEGAEIDEVMSLFLKLNEGKLPN